MVWGAVAAIGGAILNKRSQKKTNAANAKSIKDTNRTNERIARETNAANERMALDAFNRSVDHEQKVHLRTQVEQANQFVRMRDAAEAGGLNPLTALGAGSFVAGGSPVAAGASTAVAYQAMAPQASAPLVSTEALQSGFQSLGDVLTGQRSLDRAEQQARIDLMRVEAERVASGGLSRAVAAAPGAASLRTSGPAVMTTAPRQPNLTPGGPIVPARFSQPGVDNRPTQLMRDDGLTSGNPDAPVEAEIDLWAWARDGTFLENMEEVIRRNTEGKVAPRWVQHGPDHWSTRARAAIRHYTPSISIVPLNR